MHNFCIKPYVPRKPRRDPSNHRLYEHGKWYNIITDTIQNSPTRPGFELAICSVPSASRFLQATMTDILRLCFPLCRRKIGWYPASQHVFGFISRWWYRKICDDTELQQHQGCCWSCWSTMSQLQRPEKNPTVAAWPLTYVFLQLPRPCRNGSQDSVPSWIIRSGMLTGHIVIVYVWEILEYSFSSHGCNVEHK